MWQATFDGTAQGGVGRMGGGGVLYAPHGEVIELSWRWPDSGCNNEAEYRALHGVLQALVARQVLRARIWGDSDLAVRQLRGEQADKATRLAPWRDRVLVLSAAFADLQAEWIPRHRNGRADRLAGQDPDADTRTRRAQDLALSWQRSAHDGGQNVEPPAPIPRP